MKQVIRVIADAVVLYEHMVSGLTLVLERLELGSAADIEAGLPHLKGGLRPGGLTARDLPEDCRRALHQACRFEFETFGYKP